MTSVRVLPLVTLLIAGLLLAEGRYHPEEKNPSKHRHRHHHQQSESHHQLTMQKSRMDNRENELVKNRPLRRFARLPDDDDDDDDDDYYDDYDGTDYLDDSPVTHHNQKHIENHENPKTLQHHQSHQLSLNHQNSKNLQNHPAQHKQPNNQNPKNFQNHQSHQNSLHHQNHENRYDLSKTNFHDGRLRGHRTRPDSRLYPWRSRDQPRHSGHSGHHPYHRHIARNEVQRTPVWRNSNIDSFRRREIGRKIADEEDDDGDDDDDEDDDDEDDYGDDDGPDVEENEKRWRNTDFNSVGRKKMNANLKNHNDEDRNRQVRQNHQNHKNVDSDGPRLIGTERIWRSNHFRKSDDDIWKELGSHDLDDDFDDSEEINDDYFEDITEDREKPPYRTYDEIIKRLTTGESQENSGKRDYRNTGSGIEKFLMEDAFGNLKFNGTQGEGKLKGGKGSQGRGSTRSLDHDYVDDYGNNEGGRKGEAEEEEETEGNDSMGYGNYTQVEYPSNQTTPEPETSAPELSTTPKPPVKPTSRPAITITTQKINLRHNNASLSQHETSNGSSTRAPPKTKPIVRQSKLKAGMKEAIQHAIKVGREGNCRWPRARIIPVREVYRNIATTYIPHCAILHRCTDDTGCCESEALTCVPKQSQRVELYFYATSVGTGSVVEKLSFDNHTECECRGKSDYAAGTEAHPRNELTPAPQNMRVPPQKKPCRCPSEFTPRITPSGECQCKCFESDEECTHARKGKVFFSTSDRICIQKQECAMPTCEFGDFIMAQGRCPRKKDKIESIANYPLNNYFPRQRS